MSRSRALFLDRDGTLIENRHYLSDPEGVCLLPGVAEAMRRLVQAECRLFLFTNQSGVGRGWFSLGDVEACNRRMLDLIGLGPDLFIETCIATEAPDDEPRYRKPSPRFIREMIVRHDLAMDRCWMVGDSPSDWEAGQAAGIHVAAIGAQVKVESPGATHLRNSPTAFATLAACVDWLLSDGQSLHRNHS
jgi:D-glycero-D-manno-heptose 1,7-bisphosphate phosphatase